MVVSNGRPTKFAHVVGLEPLARQDLAVGMDKDEGLALVRDQRDRIERGIVEIPAIDVAADLRTAQSPWRA